MAHINKKSISAYMPGRAGATWRQFNEDPAARGYDTRWRAVRAWYIKRRPLCELCETRGILEPAVLVHHRRPIADGGAVCDPENLEALCRRCHAERHGLPRETNCFTGAKDER